MSAIAKLVCVITFAIAATTLLLATHDAVAQNSKESAELTEDILYMADGRELRGQILSEDGRQLVFEFFDRTINIKATLIIQRDDIASIERDVLVTSAEPIEEAPAETPRYTPKKTSPSSETSYPKSYGISRVDTDDPNVPALYIVPMRGQMGTDVNPEVYEKVAEDIRAHNPKMIIIEMSCQDAERTLPTLLGDFKPEETGLLDFEESRKLADIFHDELRDIPQVLWIHNAVGISSNVALSWKDLYMAPNAHLGGMSMVLWQTGAKHWKDPDIRAKMMSAFIGAAKSLLVYGGYSQEIADAMIDPEFMLSANWVGREVVWRLDDKGQYIIDGSDETAAMFDAKKAEDFAISDGTAENLDDLALLLGYREYRVIDETASKLVNDYIDDWRQAFEGAKDAWIEYHKYREWAGGGDALKNLGRAKSSLQKIISAMERFKAVEIRMGMEFGLGKLWLQVQIEQLSEEIRSLRGSDRNSTRGRGGGGLGGGLGGGGLNRR